MACTDPAFSSWIATDGGNLAGFTALRLHEADKMGEIYMIAVDPGHQRKGVGKALTDHALAWFRQQGMTTAMVETGGDPGHAPARATYEAAGFRLFPVAKYFRKV
jgi:ribosomal protein S18 acetylase RimI-like enzyme